MAKQKKQEETVDDKNFVESFLKNNKDDHFNFIERRYFKVSSGSLILDSVLDGGFTPGLHRFVGFTAGGKTSEAAEVLKNFINTVEGSKGIWFAAEGRIETLVKSGLKLVFDAKDWEVGTVFVYESNIYESVASLIEGLIRSDSTTQYGMVIDSVDGLILRDDFTSKGFNDASKVAGGAVIASLLMKRNSIPLAKKGHLAIFISQVRAEIKLDTYSSAPVRQITSTGGNALLHYSNEILQFEPQFKGDMICTNEKEAPSQSNPLLGHWAKVIIKKSSNDKKNYVIKYPIKYDRKNGARIWTEKEIVDCLMQWGDLERRGAWYNFSEDIVSSGILPKDTSNSFQGIDRVFEFLSKEKEVRDKLYLRLCQSISGAYSVEIEE